MATETIYVAQTSIWLNWFFYIACALFLTLIGYIIYHYVTVYFRSLTRMRFHMIDGNIQMQSFKPGEVLPEMNIWHGETTQDGNKVMTKYFIRPECIEQGKWGKYIEYDQGVSEPLNPKIRRGQAEQLRLPQLFKFISGLLNTDLAVDLFLSSKFKDFVKMMMYIILVTVILVGIVSAIPLMYHPVQKCVLPMDNVTISTIRIAMGV